MMFVNVEQQSFFFAVAVYFEFVTVCGYCKIWMWAINESYYHKNISEIRDSRKIKITIYGRERYFWFYWNTLEIFVQNINRFHTTVHLDACIATIIINLYDHVLKVENDMMVSQLSECISIWFVFPSVTHLFS